MIIERFGGKLMKQMVRRIPTILLLIAMLIVTIPRVEVYATYSATDVSSKLNTLISKYNNKYDSSWSYAGGTQCFGFAHLIFDNIFNRGSKTVGGYSNGTEYKFNYTAGDITTIGTAKPGSSAETVGTLLRKCAPGDYIQVKRRESKGAHSMICVSASENSIDLFDANAHGDMKVRHYTQSFSEFLRKNDGVSVYRYSDYVPWKVTPPTYSNFWVDHYLFDLSETVSFTAVASGADNYTIGIDKTGVGRVVTEGCGSTYTISADRLGAGEYSAYMTVANSAGYVDTYRVYFVVAEKCNFGDKFSARIQNIGTGCYITNKDSKIVGTPESGYNNQIWFFNKYSDGSYTIMSQLDGLMMDVSYIDDPPAGADVHAWESTGKWNQRFNIYYLDDAFYIRPANTKTLVVDMGAGEPYNVACYNLSRNAGQQKYRFDMVGMGDYIPYGLGDEFYAQLRCQGTNLYVTNQSGNVAGAAATADDSQIWKFMRQSNGAYVIQNTLDGSYIDVENSNDANKTNFLSYNEYTGNRNQQFYFYEMDNAFYIKPLISNTRVMDMQSTAPYNVALWDKGNDWGPQKFDVIKVSHSDDNMSKSVETSYFKGHKYELYNESMTWESAKLFCEKKGGHLVTISDEKENEFVNGMRCRNLSTDYQQSIWLGGSDTANEGTWSWITGEPFTYSNWKPNEPNGGTSQNYLQMYSSGNWDDVQNEAGRFVLCEYDSVQPKLTPVASSLSLSDNIGFNIYMQISDDVLSDDGAMMIITNSDGKVIKKPISSYETTTYQDKSVKKIVSMIPAAKMSGKLSFKILKSDGTESSAYICSVMDYANEMIKKADTDAECKKALPLVKAMLNYGAYSQIYFGEDKTNLANAILKDDNTATIKSEDIIKSITYSEQGLFSNKDLEYMGSSLICESDTSLKLYFNNKNKLTEKQIKSRYDISMLDKNKHDYDTGVDGSIFWIKIKGIKPAELGNVYGVNLVSDDGSVIVETSPYVYVKKALESGDSRLQNLCKAMWAYGQAAREYL